MRTITLELLRHGPAHNQLLSPLTPYLALCENHAAVTLHVPFEHNQFLHRLSALNYRNSLESRDFQLSDTARAVGEILGMIPGLTAESNKQDGTPGALTHLRLILSASELALLPFELALAPSGFPGAGQPMALQPQMPLCITREIRRVPGELLQWPTQPRILFVAASPPGVGSIPLESHLLALRRAIVPWVKFFREGDNAMREKRLAEHLVFLPDASVEAIEEKCASEVFTHVHILAHGVERPENYDTRFFLALHNPRDPDQVDYISGSRLATALRASQRPDARGLSRPAVVTLASCNSGSIGSVAGAGASIAHALHEAGIPMVVAGQFPLSFEGSVRLVECLYEGMLWGTDPRPLLYDLRRRLYAQFPEAHDWGSLTAYVSLPPDFDQQLSEIKIGQAMRSIDAAMNHADETTRRAYEQVRPGRRSATPTADTEEDDKVLLDVAQDKMKAARKRLEKLLEYLPEKKSRIHGLLASTDKRHAEILHSASKISSIDSATRERHASNSLGLLRKARDHYWDAFVLDRSKSWAVVQFLSLACVLNRLKQPAADNPPPPSEPVVSAPPADEPGLEVPPREHAGKIRPERDLGALWSLARHLSLYDHHSDDRQIKAWGHGNLMELYLLSLIMERREDWPDENTARSRALEHADSLIDIAGRLSFEVYSTRRQIFRYVQWFAEISTIGPAHALAEQIFEKFPEEVEEKWK
ncbi:MAG TPA: CHAT domain-containing protein [Longimicrobiaceae bacterium]|nr:CHAT domain-containing protein [Longimicrobiaceae bacterium]